MNVIEADAAWGGKGDSLLICETCTAAIGAALSRSLPDVDWPTLIAAAAAERDSGVEPTALARTIRAAEAW